MNCVRPPLLRKPARGFGWSCGSCSRKQERRLEARNTTSGDKNIEGEDEEVIEEEDEDHGPSSENANGKDTEEISTFGSRPPTAEQLAQAKLWPYRYLGIHCRVEDALDYDDRIYPRASSRLGPKHQAIVQPWYGRPVRLVKPADIKKKMLKGNNQKKDAKLTKDTIAALEADRVNRENRPKWIMDEPVGYQHRGDDLPNEETKNTARLLFRMPDLGSPSTRGDDSASLDLTPEEREAVIDGYMKKAKDLAHPLFNLRDFSTNFLDKALELLTKNEYNGEEALAELAGQKRRQDLKEPELTEEEIRRFEDGVARFGSELRNVSRHVGKSQSHGEIVRFYYMWKKTDRGRRIWENYEGRKGKKQAKQADARLLDDVADDEDDSSFDSSKAAQRKRGFECKFCTTRRSPQWRRAPATAPGTTIPPDSSAKGVKDRGNHLTLALCQRCAGLWRKYGIQWENIDEVAKKVAQGGGRAWKRRIDEELLIELVNANQDSSIGLSSTVTGAAAAVGLEISSNPTSNLSQELPRKKLKATNGEISNVPGQPIESIEEAAKKKAPEKPPEPQLIPEAPTPRLYPCDICNAGIREDPSLITCRHCRLTVHPNCYGITKDRPEKWMCDTCANDINPQYSTIYECLLCPQYENEDKSVMEPPKQSHKKKSDREKEKDRLERELITEQTALYYKQQQEKGRPTEPRQSLKPTAGRNWCHVICSIMHEPIKFFDAPQLMLAEGMESLSQITPRMREARCKLCKVSSGAVLFCEQCEAPVHASCAQRYGYTIGITLSTKPKNSLRQMTIGDVSGLADAKVFCREHGEKKNVFALHTPVSIDGEEMNVLKAYATTHKGLQQGSLTGTARKADMVQAATKHAAAAALTQGAGIGNPRSKNHSSEVAALSTRSSRVSPAALTIQSEEMENGDRIVHMAASKTGVDDNGQKVCIECKIRVSPVWHVAERERAEVDPGTQLQPPLADTNHEIRAPEAEGSELRTEVEDVSRPRSESPPLTSYMCHKCYIRVQKNPPPPVREASPPQDSKPDPEPVLEPKQEEQEPRPLSPLPRPGWQPPNGLVAAPPPSQLPGPEIYRSWLGPTEPAHGPYPAPGHPLNGVPHSSPAASAATTPHYAPAPPAPPPPPPPPLPPALHHVSARYPHPAPYPYREDRVPPPAAFRPGQPMQYMAPQSSGFSAPEPQSFQYKRDPVTHQLIKVPYTPPGVRGAENQRKSSVSVRSPPTGHHLRSPSLHVRSPPAHEQGPHGPPEADSNPFAVPNGRSSGASPPLPPPGPGPGQYGSNGVYNSPRLRQERQDRPETPTRAYDREPRWPSENALPNGASASPSVRNLLH